VFSEKDSEVFGQLVPTWRETWKYIWAKMLQGTDEPNQLAVEIFREFAVPPPPPPEPPMPADGAYDTTGALIDPEALDRAAAYKTALAVHKRRLARHEEALNGVGTRRALHALIMDAADTERSAINFLERGFVLAEEFGGDALANRFYLLVDAFLEKFNLRYDLRRPFTLHPTLSGVFASMMQDLKTVAHNDTDLQPMFHDFEEALRDLTAESSERLIKTCIQKQINLLEALGQKSPGVTANSLGQICDQIGVWPHASVSDAMKNLYKFACNYPGIRHAGTPANRLRAIEMKDMVAVSVLLAGFTPYLSHQLDAEAIYRR
jgi:hypothetical protein